MAAARETARSRRRPPRQDGAVSLGKGRQGSAYLGRRQAGEAETLQVRQGPSPGVKLADSDMAVVAQGAVWIRPTVVQPRQTSGGRAAAVQLLGHWLLAAGSGLFGEALTSSIFGALTEVARRVGQPVVAVLGR